MVRNFIVMVIVLAIVFPAGISGRAEEKSRGYEVNSRELKLLLKGEKFQRRRAAVREFWGMVKSLATEKGINIFESRRILQESQREIYFLDTDENVIKKNNYSLRIRTKAERRRKKGYYEISLKYRSPDRAKASMADVNMTPGYRPEMVFEEDMSIDPGAPGGVKSVFSLRSRIKKMLNPVEATIGGFTEVFPVLGTLGLPPETKLEKVNDLTIMELKYTPGSLDFGDGIKAFVDIAVWYEWDGNIPLIAEFSYKHTVADHENLPPGAEKCVEFIKELAERVSEWTAGEQSKTSFTYGLDGGGDGD
ncbi:MAG: hypothetical protein GF307_12515 [candidate division Zixibacteria bacterium]|nr:hypothetical protein [candidate division Zixibacteria bacterium]